MNRYIIPLLLALLGSSCVTAQDLRDVASQVDRIEIAAADSTKTDAEVKDEIAQAHAAIEEIAADVEERTKGAITSLGAGTEGGLIGIASALALNFYRNSTRRKNVVMKDHPA